MTLPSLLAADFGIFRVELLKALVHYRRVMSLPLDKFEVDEENNPEATEKIRKLLRQPVPEDLYDPRRLEKKERFRQAKLPVQPIIKTAAHRFWEALTQGRLANYELLRRKLVLFPRELNEDEITEFWVQQAVPAILSQSAPRSWSKHGGYDAVIQDFADACVEVANQLQTPALGPGVKTSHGPDFTSVMWYGTQYTFNHRQQATVMRVLWNAWEKGSHRVSWETIKNEINPEGENFRLSKVFREKSSNGTYRMHPVWNKVIANNGKGVYWLQEPKPARRRRKKQVVKKARPPQRK